MKSRPRYEDLYFESQTTGWVLRSDGVLRFSNDGFETDDEYQVAELCGGRARCLAVRDRTLWVGILRTNRNEPAPPRILRSNDGGRSWTVCLPAAGDGGPPAPSGGVCGMFALPDRVLALGTYDENDCPDLLCTTDDGDTWESVLPAQTRHKVANLVAVSFRDHNLGIAIGGQFHDVVKSHRPVLPLILRTTDGGSSWTEVEAPTLVGYGWYGWKVQFLGDADVFMALSNDARLDHGYLLHSSDCGMSWAPITVRASGLSQINLLGVGMCDRQRGWVGSSGTDWVSLYTEDSGSSWQDCEQSKRANRFQMFDARGYAVGDSGDAPIFHLKH